MQTKMRAKVDEVRVFVMARQKRAGRHSQVVVFENNLLMGFCWCDIESTVGECENIVIAYQLIFQC